MNLKTILANMRHTVTDGFWQLREWYDEGTYADTSTHHGLDMAALEDRVMLSATPMAPIVGDAALGGAMDGSSDQVVTADEVIFPAGNSDASQSHAEKQDGLSERGFLESDALDQVARREVVRAVP